MGKRIPELPALSFSEFAKDDFMNISHVTVTEDETSYQSRKLEVKELSNYISALSNGGFKGVASEAGLRNLDDFTYKHCGVWRFDGDCVEIGIRKNSGALVEMICYEKDNPKANLIQRVCYGPSVYFRTKHIWDDGEMHWHPWERMSNVNGNLIDSGIQEITMTNKVYQGRINFTDDIFAGYYDDNGLRHPAVLCSIESPLISTRTDSHGNKIAADENYIYCINVKSVSSDGFTYIIAAVPYYHDKLNEKDADGNITSRQPRVTMKQEETTINAGSYEQSLKSVTVDEIVGEWKGSSTAIKVHYIATMEVT